MKKILLALAAFLVCQTTFAKKVKFTVDMSLQTVNVTGVHVTGDFQVLAGYPADWESNTTTMLQDPADTNMYSIVVDIPAFAKYEYKFVNGDQFYEAEFVPVESRIGYNFNDNRWIYVDSLADDTTFVGAIQFAANAPAGKNLLRLIVDLQNEPSVSPDGVHVAGNFQNWNTTSDILYSFGGTVYEKIVYVDPSSTIDYKFYNGNTPSSAEIVPGQCSVNSNRELVMSADTVFAAAICFASCGACSSTGLTENAAAGVLSAWPNPANDQLHLELPGGSARCTVKLFDMFGRLCYLGQADGRSTIQVERNQLPAGLYTVHINDLQKRSNTVAKVTFQ